MSEISAASVMATVKEFYDITDTKKDAFITLKIFDARRDIKSYKYVTQDTFELDVCDCKATLPCNWMNEDSIIVLPPCEEGCIPIIYSNFTFDGVVGCQVFPNRFKIQGDTLCFPSNFEYDTVRVYCDILNVGDDGFPIIPISHLTYYERFLLYWVGLKMKDVRYKEFNDYATVRRNTITNENATKFNLGRLSFGAIVKSFTGLPRYAGYRGLNLRYNGETTT